MIHHVGIFLLLLSSVAEINFCYASQQPELQILDQDGQNSSIFCPGSTVRLKCIFPEEMEAWLWYVNGSGQPIEAKSLWNIQGHSVQLSSEAGYTLVNISKEKPYRANYSCAVFHISDNILSNSVEVIFKGTLYIHCLHGYIQYEALQVGIFAITFCPNCRYTTR